MRILFSILIVLGVHSQSSGQNFTAEAFCENPRSFICGQNRINADSELRQRIIEIVDRLKQRFPSFALYMNQRNFEPTIDNLMRLNGEFRRHLGMKAIEALLQVYPELANVPQTEIDETRNYVSVMNTVGTDYVMIPEKEVVMYYGHLQSHIARERGFDSVQMRLQFSILVESDPILSQANKDFGFHHYSGMNDVNEELTNAMREAFSDEIALGLARHRAQIPALRNNMHQTLRDLGFSGGEELVNSRLGSISMDTKPRNSPHCNTIRKLAVHNASIDRRNGQIQRCEDNYIYFSNQDHINVFSNNHEIAHLFDFEGARDLYHPTYFSCIVQEFGEDLHRGHDILSLPDDVVGSMNELSADYIGVAATVRYIRENNLSESETLSLLSREFQGTYCDNLGSANAIGHRGHADDRVRLNRILGGSPQLQEYLGCQRFQNSVPVNPCHPFQENSINSASDAGATQGSATGVTTRPIEN